MDFYFESPSTHSFPGSPGEGLGRLWMHYQLWPQDGNVALRPQPRGTRAELWSWTWEETATCYKARALHRTAKLDLPPRTAEPTGEVISASGSSMCAQNLGGPARCSRPAGWRRGEKTRLLRSYGASWLDRQLLGLPEPFGCWEAFRLLGIAISTV